MAQQPFVTKEGMLWQDRVYVFQDYCRYSSK